jgi:hypothetical protein
MGGEMRTEAIELIKEHVRFEEDFVDEMPTSVATGSQELKDQWIFLQAGAWPDIARDLPSFHHSTWHYVNFPHVLKPEDRAELDLSHVNLKAALPATIEDEDDLNILQAMLLNEKVLQAGSSSDAKKAIHLCWLMHLVGDIHQPLHSTSLFTTGVFSDSDGDRGGNQIEVGSSNLHSFWDNTLGNPTTVANIGSRAEDAVSEFGELGLEAARFTTGLDWAQESHELAKEAVYTEAITDVVREQDDNLGSTVSVNLTPEYEAKAEAVARARIVQAGFRLAKAIEETVAK